MTNDSKLFPRRTKWEEESYRPDEYGNWLRGNWQPYSGEQNILKRPRDLILSADGTSEIKLQEVEDVALPLYQGAMIHQFDFCAAAYRRIEGKRGFKWEAIAWPAKYFNPQYLMGLTDYLRNGGNPQATMVGFRDIAPTTNQRTMIAATIAGLPCSNKVPTLSVAETVRAVSLTANLNSFAFDWTQRIRQAGTTLNWYILEEQRALRPTALFERYVWPIASALGLAHVRFAPQWIDHRTDSKWKGLWAVSPAERIRMRVISEVIISHFGGVSAVELKHILADCDHPVASLENRPFARTLDPKGFWRQEKHSHPELRLSVLSQVAMVELEALGIRAFVEQNDGGGWQIPKTLRLADYGLGHDDRAKEHQPVAAPLGPRFYPWQLEQSVEESWEECERHEEILSRLLLRNVEEPEFETEDGTIPPVNLFGDPLPTDLFGNLIGTKTSRR